VSAAVTEICPDSTKPCPICSVTATTYSKARILRKRPTNILCCPSCSFVFLDPVYWLKEAYGSAISPLDVGHISRNGACADYLQTVLDFTTGPDDFFVDYGGGTGLLVRLMRDRGFHFHLLDPYAPNLFAPYFCVDRGRFSYRALTAVEVFEHLENPVQSVSEMHSLSDCILFTTEVTPTAMPRPSEWSYFGFEHGQHVGFYSSTSLSRLAARFQLTYTRLSSSWHAFHTLEEPIVRHALKYGNRPGLMRRLERRFARKAPTSLRSGLLERDYQVIRELLETQEHNETAAGAGPCLDIASDPRVGS